MLVQTSFALAVLAYLILCYGILFKNAVQPLSATLLWLLLDSLAAFTAYSSGGNWMLAAGYALGCLLAATATLYRHRVHFVGCDRFITILVVVCVMVWLGVGDLAGLIASSLAMFIAGIPAMLHYIRRPSDGQLTVWLLYSAANVIGLIGREANNLEDWFFQVCALAGSGIVTIFLIKGKLSHKSF